MSKSQMAIKILREGVDLRLKKISGPLRVGLGERGEEIRRTVDEQIGQLCELKREWGDPKIAKSLHNDFFNGYNRFRKPELDFEYSLYRLVLRHNMDVQQYYECRVRAVNMKFDYYSSSLVQ